MSFNHLLLDPKILKALEKVGYIKPTQIQEKAIPEILLGKDIRGSALTGSGKTAAFVLPMIHKIISSQGDKGRGPKALIIVPTRELATQATEQITKYCKFLPKVKTVCIFGGVSYHIQERQLSRPYDILVATPGRLSDYIKKRKINFSNLQTLVLDEADRMLDMGFQEDLDLIIEALPQNRQTLLFSATFEASTKKLSDHLLNDPLDVIVNTSAERHTNIESSIHYVDNLGHKNRLLGHLLSDEAMQACIIFTSTKRHAEVLVNELKRDGHKAIALHGDMNQNHRTRTIQKVRAGKADVLVATDVAARGLDIKSISHVINFDLPRNPEDYVHRIGRTGRAGSNGIALSFVGHQDRSLVDRIQKFTGQEIEVKVIEGFEPTKQPSANKRAHKPKRGRFSKRSDFKAKKGAKGNFAKRKSSRFRSYQSSSSR